MNRSSRIVLAAVVAIAALAAPAPEASAASSCGATPPPRLADTGLYADLSKREIARGVLPYSPQYPLWTDGAHKRRWISLPEGTSIDASDPDRWIFPIGTKLWKEFAFERAVETRMMELGANGEWSFATYLWSADGSDATLASDRGVKGAYVHADGLRYDVPSRADCRACHDAHPSRVLGFGALQLSTDRDPLAPNAQPPAADEIDLAKLVELGLVRNLPRELVLRAPRIRARTPRERAVLGYLHANCAACHNASGPLKTLGMSLEYSLAAQAAPALDTALGVASRFRSGVARIAAGDPDHSLVAQRMSSRSPLLQMPPFGTRAVDPQATELVAAWIREDLDPARASTLSENTIQPIRRN
jgi:hypothetical protein